MVSFTPDQLTVTASLGVADDERLAGAMAGYLSTGDAEDCLLVNVDGLLETIFSAL